MFSTVCLQGEATRSTHHGHHFRRQIIIFNFQLFYRDLAGARAAPAEDTPQHPQQGRQVNDDPWHDWCESSWVNISKKDSDMLKSLISCWCGEIVDQPACWAVSLSSLTLLMEQWESFNLNFGKKCWDFVPTGLTPSPFPGGWDTKIKWCLFCISGYIYTWNGF